MKKYFLLLLSIIYTMGMNAWTWDQVMESGEFYWGVGLADTQAEAEKAAMANLVSMIAVHVSSDFNQIDDITVTNGNVEHQSKVLMCLQTYSQASFTNLQSMPTDKKGKQYQARFYIKRSELYQMFESRKERAANMASRGDEFLERGKVDLALEYYYHAYSLVRSLQYPNEAKDKKGNMLMVDLPAKIKDIMGRITVEYADRDGDFVDLLFYYEGKPVSSLDFTYNDGYTNECTGQAKDGRGMLEMASGYETDFYHLSIEYEYKNQSLGDPELESVLNVITKRYLGSEKTVSARLAKKEEKKDTPDVLIADASAPKATTSGRMAMPEDAPGVNLSPSETQKPLNEAEYAVRMEKIVLAIRKRNVVSVEDMFTIDALDVYKRLLTRYGTPRIIGTPNFAYFKGLNNTVTCRGMQMSFSFNDVKKASFVEDMVFTFDSDMKVCNIAFGLGQKATSDILCIENSCPEDAKELLVEFMENYKTAYCLKRIDYIRDVFADDATIIVGHVLRKGTNSTTIGNHRMTQAGEDSIRYNRYTKDTYLQHLQRCFNNPRNKYINIRFGQNDVQWLFKFADKDPEKNREIYAINISQEYSSTTYSDKGFLFLMIDMTNHAEPLIKVRTWQPNEESIEKLYHAGWFFDM